MCGITGRFNYDPRRPIDRDVLVAMTDAVAHRGPDAAGYYQAPGIALGHRRLSIIDLATGDQPLGNEDGSIQVVFNGEIYNFAEVRAELLARGHRFRTESDTEIIVHGYEEWGDRAVDRFRGMFAFALWDAGARRLLLARDRLGVKPLYYSEIPGAGIVFGSEIKSLLQDPDVPRDWRADALDAYLTLLYVPAPDTIYRAVHKLPPGHMLVAEHGQVRISRYWDLQFTGDGTDAREEEYLEELDHLLREAVGLRLISDVPLGAFLSGGIDSSTVVAYMKEVSDTPPVTIAVGFDNQALRRSGARGDRRAAPGLRVPPARGQSPGGRPVAEAGVALRRAVRGLLGRADVLRLEGRARARDRRAVGGWRRRALGGIRPAPRRADRTARPRGARLRGTAGRLDRPGAAAVGQGRAVAAASRVGSRAGVRVEARLRHVRAEREVAPLLPAISRTRSATPTRSPASATPIASCASLDPMDRALYVDARTYMIDDVLTKVDRMSMAVSLEAREPLLDHKLLEFAARVPVSLKLKNGQSKYLLRRILERRVPRAISERGKRGFAAPIGDWLRGPLAPMTARAAARRPAARSRHLPAARGGAALGRTPDRTRRASAPAVAARHAGALVPALHRRGARAGRRRGDRGNRHAHARQAPRRGVRG